jgi:hypothetical protein
MNLYANLTAAYNQFLALFPLQIQWFVTLIVLIGLVVAFINLIRFNWLFLILLVLLLPVIFPILHTLIDQLYQFFLFLWGIVKAGAPQV